VTEHSNSNRVLQCPTSRSYSRPSVGCVVPVPCAWLTPVWSSFRLFALNLERGRVKLCLAKKPLCARRRRRRSANACRGGGSAVGPLLAARALPLRCAASTMLSSALLALYLTRTLAVVNCGSGSGRVCQYPRLEKLLILCLHPRCWGSIFPGADATATVAVCAATK
jgi:hypothetical protein